MAKATKTGNTAVAGITGTSTSSPTTGFKETITNTGTTKSPAAGSGSKSSSGGSSKSSVKIGDSSASQPQAAKTQNASPVSTAAEEKEPPYSEQFYAAFANGIPASTNVGELQDTRKAAAATREIMSNAKSSIPNANVAPIDYVDIAQQKAELKARENSDKARAVQAADYAVAKGVNELARGLEEGKALYQTQRNQVDADEAKALDNQVLYAEARGDRGGLGKAQYGAIQNTAANNRAAVNSAEVKLQNDTTRQIADLRAQGEFEKADKVLAVSSQYLKELQELEKWAKEKNVGVQEFNAKLSEWQKEYTLDVGKYLTDTELAAAKLSGAFPDGSMTADYRNAVNNRYVNAGKAMMSAGIVPSASQLESMGWTPEQYWIYRMSNGM